MKIEKYLYETHMHTEPVSACADATPSQQVRAYKKRGYAGIIITDHFVNGSSGCPHYLPWFQKMDFLLSGYEKAKKEGDKCGLDVFFGWEYSIDGADFLTYGLDIDFLYKNPNLEDLNLRQYSSLIRKEGGFLAQAHPFREGFWIKSPYPAESYYMDAVEVFNANMPDHVNIKAYNYALLHDLPMMSGSDSHSDYTPTVGGVSLSEKAESIHDIIEAIKSNQAGLVLPAKFRERLSGPHFGHDAV